MEIPPVIPPALSPSNSHSAPPPPRKKYKGIFVAAFVGLFAFMLAGAVAASFLFYASSPQRSICNLHAAIERHDRKTIEKYVDATQLAASTRKAISQVIERAEVSDNNGDFMAKLFKPLGYKIVEQVLDETFTPEAVLDAMSGDDAGQIMKRGINNFIDHGVDGVTRRGDEKEQRAGLVGKLVLGCLGDYLVDSGFKDAKMNHLPTPKVQTVSSGQYEGINQYAVTIKCIGDYKLTIAYVYERHGLFVWKLSEIRLLELPQQPSTVALH